MELNISQTGRVGVWASYCYKGKRYTGFMKQEETFLMIKLPI